jgi:hypothetical protein
MLTTDNHPMVRNTAAQVPIAEGQGFFGGLGDLITGPDTTQVAHVGRIGKFDVLLRVFLSTTSKDTKSLTGGAASTAG